MDFLLQNSLEAPQVPPSVFDNFLDHLETHLSVSDNNLSHYLLNDTDVCDNVEAAIQEQLSPPPSPSMDFDLDLLLDASPDYLNEYCKIGEDLHSLDLCTILGEKNLTPAAAPLINNWVPEVSEVDAQHTLFDVATSLPVKVDGVAGHSIQLLSPPPSPPSTDLVMLTEELSSSDLMMNLLSDSDLSASLEEIEEAMWVPEATETVVVKSSPSPSRPQPTKRSRKSCLSASERRANKQLSNRESAARYRDKIKIERRQQQEHLASLEQENARLREAMRQCMQEEYTLVKILRGVEKLRRHHQRRL